jgi:hypothetical protein
MEEVTPGIVVKSPPGFVLIAVMRAAIDPLGTPAADRAAGTAAGILAARRLLSTAVKTLCD